jgi:hypothetical protein
MQIIWRFLGQRPDLATVEPLPLTPGVGIGPGPGDWQDSYDRVMAQEAPGVPEPDGPFDALSKAILGYEIFPPRLVSGVLSRNPVQLGDTYGICYHVMPGIDFFFAGRVTAVFREEADGICRTGFTFRTVIGHPELGEETFWVEKNKATGTVRAGLRSWSRPGTWWTRLGKPFARRTQVRACYAALDHLQQVAQSARKQGRPEVK